MRTGTSAQTWGAGFFVGSYPVKDRLGVIVAGDRRGTARGRDAFIAGIRRQVEDDSPRLARGDAATGFLPTAGIGAGMAMESAWVLADRLRGVSSAELPQAVASYEAAQRPRVDAAQDDSRQLARVMFRRSRMVARIRDLVARFVTLDVALGPIRQLVEHRPLTGVVGHSGR